MLNLLLRASLYPIILPGRSYKVLLEKIGNVEKYSDYILIAVAKILEKYAKLLGLSPRSRYVFNLVRLGTDVLYVPTSLDSKKIKKLRSILKRISTVPLLVKVFPQNLWSSIEYITIIPQIPRARIAVIANLGRLLAEVGSLNILVTRHSFGQLLSKLLHDISKARFRGLEGLVNYLALSYLPGLCTKEVVTFISAESLGDEKAIRELEKIGNIKLSDVEKKIILNVAKVASQKH